MALTRREKIEAAIKAGHSKSEVMAVMVADESEVDLVIAFLRVNNIKIHDSRGFRPQQSGELYLTDRRKMY